MVIRLNEHRRRRSLALYRLASPIEKIKRPWNIYFFYDCSRRKQVKTNELSETTNAPPSTYTLQSLDALIKVNDLQFNVVRISVTTKIFGTGLQPAYSVHTCICTLWCAVIVSSRYCCFYRSSQHSIEVCSPRPRNPIIRLFIYRNIYRGQQKSLPFHRRQLLVLLPDERPTIERIRLHDPQLERQSIVFVSVNGRWHSMESTGPNVHRTQWQVPVSCSSPPLVLVVAVLWQRSRRHCKTPVDTLHVTEDALPVGRLHSDHVVHFQQRNDVCMFPTQTIARFVDSTIC